jgi:hypothetical protein
MSKMSSKIHTTKLYTYQYYINFLVKQDSFVLNSNLHGICVWVRKNLYSAMEVAIYSRTYD